MPMTTVQRAILDVVRESDEHFTADQIYWKVKQLIPSVAVGSVYRNLNRFMAANQIRRVARPGAADRFERNLLPHEHAACVECGKITDVRMPELREYVMAHSSLNVLSVNLVIDHLCPECAQKRTGGSVGK